MESTPQSDTRQQEDQSDRTTLEQLEKQMEYGSLFTHSVVSQNADRIYEAESFLYGLIDLLIEKAVVSKEEVLKGAELTREEMDERGHTIGPGIGIRVDEHSLEDTETVPVNCSDRIHVCKSICCKLQFALTAEEVESGSIKWNLGEPYFIRQDESGRCFHADKNGKGCTIYDHRPGVCRTYSCANDKRIWSDFEKMILNQKWIDSYMGPSNPRLVAIQMHPVPETELTGVSEVAEPEEDRGKEEA